MQIRYPLYIWILCIGFLSLSASFSFAADETDTGREMLTLRWKSFDEETTYRFQMARDRDFTQIVQDKLTDNPYITVPRPSESATYYVRVKPIFPDGQEGNFLKTQSLVVDSSLPPPKILYPTEISEIRFEDDITVRWTRVRGAEGYHMMLAGDRSFREILMDIPHVSDTSYRLSGLGYGTYFLRVCSIAEDGAEGPFSPRRTFILVPH